VNEVKIAVQRLYSSLSGNSTECGVHQGAGRPSPYSN